MSKTQEDATMDESLLEILRCPVGVRQTGKDDPGRLKLIKGCWLVCEETSMKYPIRNGIPVMLIEEAERWKDTAVDQLPVPPPE